MDGGNGNAALLYIYILTHAGELDTDDAVKRLKITPDALLDALSFLEGKGIVGKTETARVPERSDEIPEYSQTDVAEHMGSDRDFRFLADFCEERFGRLLSTVDLQVLLGIYSWLGLPVDVICLLVTSCIEETKKRYGAGRVPTMRAIEKAAKVWVRNGVMTAGRAEEFLREQKKLGSDKARIAKILGIAGRGFSQTEDKYVSHWLSLEIPDELIGLAYDKTIINTGSLKWNYMNKILLSWSELGYKTVEDTERGERREKNASGEEFDEAAALRLRELSRKNRTKREDGSL